MTDHQHPPLEARLRATVAPLEASALRYTVHEAAPGTPYAAFRWNTDGLPALNCTAVIHGGAWRLTAHVSTNGGSAAPSPGALAARNDRLPLVRGLTMPGTGELSAVLSLRLRPSLLSGEGMIDLLVHLAASVAFLRGELPAAPPLPVLGIGGSMGAGASHSSVFAADQELLVNDPAPGWCQLTLRAPGLAWARLAERPELVNRLHDWTPVGTLVARDAEVAARVTTLVGEPGLPDWSDLAVEDAHRLLDAVLRAG